jgi:hypothetical protein
MRRVSPATAAFLRAAVRSSLQLGAASSDAGGARDAEVVRRGAGSVDADELRVAAAYHRVQPLVRAAVRSQPGGERLLPEVEGGYWAGVSTHVRAMTDLRLAAATLDGAGVGWAAFKGPVLAETCYPRPDLRFYTDLDLLVDPAQFPEALAALESAGFTVLDRNWELLNARLPGELHLRAPAGTIVDLHWHLLNRPENRRRLRMPSAQFLAASRRVAVRELSVPVLMPADAVVHLSVHAGLTGGDRLLWLCDLALSMRAIEDVTLLSERARACGAANLVAVMLSRTAEIDDSPALAQAVARLATPSRRAVLTAARKASPIAGVAAPHGLARFLALTTETTAAGTAGSVVRGLTRRLWSGGRLPDDAVETRADNPMSVLYPAGGPRRREAFLARVATEGTVV